MRHVPHPRLAWLIVANASHRLLVHLSVPFDRFFVVDFFFIAPDDGDLLSAFTVVLRRSISHDGDLFNFSILVHGPSLSSTYLRYTIGLLSIADFHRVRTGPFDRDQ